MSRERIGKDAIAHAFMMMILYHLVVIFLVIGEIRCIYKMATCNWEPVGKAEIFYTFGIFTGIGAIIGWINIEDK